MVYVPASADRFEAAGGTNAFSQLTLMARHVPRVSNQRSNEGLKHKSDHAWGLYLNNHSSGFNPKAASTFFGIPLAK